MVRKKIDNRLRVMIENGVATNHRSMFVVVGDRGRDQVVILHHMLSKTVVKARPSVLWCYKKELGFTSHRKKRMRQIQKKIRSGKLDMKDDDPFELFVAATNIRYCYYSETHKILGNTFGMCVLQDFEALSPNLLARTVETVEGGGVIVLLLKSVASLRQLYTLSMDVHARFRTHAHHDVVGRFNERFILSLGSCETCLVIDDQLTVLPISSKALNVTALPPKPMDAPLPPAQRELADLKTSLADTQPVGVLVSCCRTLDQAKALLKFIEAISEKTLRTTVAMTAARGRGKSAALGLAMASAVAFGYSNIFVTAPSPENLKTLFEFIFKGFDALEYQEHVDYELVQSTNPDFNKAIVRVNVFREHRQTIQYVHPSDAAKLGQAELVCVDEAAAIPLPLVRALMGPYLVFMSSTVNGYEGTGRSLSLKLIQELRTSSAAAADGKTQAASARVLHEVSLCESIRYGVHDPVERWLYDVLCLDATSVKRVSSGCPLPADCDLYYVNRDTLFSYHKASEEFLQRLMSLFVASHYKNTPNDLQLLSDAPAHHVFVLLPPVPPASNALPEVLCVLQVCLEGQIARGAVQAALQRGQRAAGDLLPWTVSQQFQDTAFPELSGARVVRIATHPDYQSMGYGGRALSLLADYYEGRMPDLSESADDTSASAEPTSVSATTADEAGLCAERVAPRANLPPLLTALAERAPERLDYLGVSFGLTAPLLRFWRRAHYAPVYLRQTRNELTGEHTCVMLRTLRSAADGAGHDGAENGQGDEGGGGDGSASSATWLRDFWRDFRRRMLALLGGPFRHFPPSLAMQLIEHKTFPEARHDVVPDELMTYVTRYDTQRLTVYGQNLVDYHLVVDVVPALARLYFLRGLSASLSALQEAILLTLGLQQCTVDETATGLGLPAAQVLALFNRAVRKLAACIEAIEERAEAAALPASRSVTSQLQPLAASLDSELTEAAAEVSGKHAAEHAALMRSDLQQFAIRGSEDDWAAGLKGATNPAPSSILTIKSAGEKRKVSDVAASSDKPSQKHKKHKSDFKKGKNKVKKQKS